MTHAPEELDRLEALLAKATPDVMRVEPVRPSHAKVVATNTQGTLRLLATALQALPALIASARSHASALAAEREADWTIERDAQGEAIVCTGCGTTRTLDHIRYINPKALSCCPERKMIPVRDAIAAGRREGLEEAAKVAEGEMVREPVDQDEHGWNWAAEKIAAAIRARGGGA